ncbi:MAG: hypothetical protein QN178_00840 [Armatimonadota bacterium]|nr:hypothetical protein [Armatimonadota bacterium]
MPIDTDAGVYGVAGHQFYGGEEACVTRMAAYLVGEEPLRIEKHAATLRCLWPAFGAAVWLVEIALWDIVGKVQGSRSTSCVATPATPGWPTPTPARTGRRRNGATTPGVGATRGFARSSRASATRG